MFSLTGLNSQVKQGNGQENLIHHRQVIPVRHCSGFMFFAQHSLTLEWDERKVEAIDDEMMCMCWKQYSNYAEYTGRPAERHAADGKRDV